MQEKGEWSDVDLEAVMDRSSLFLVRLPPACRPPGRLPAY